MDKLISAIQEYFKKKGPEIVRSLQDELRKKKKEASGKLINSVESQVTIRGTRVWLRVLADETIAYVIGGRRKGKAVPIDDIETWINEARIKPKGDKKSLPWALAASIKKKGVKGVKVVQPVAKKADKEIDEDLEDIIADALEDEITAGIASEAAADGLTVQIN